MGIEIERKFLLVSDEWKGLAPPVSYRQGYLCRDDESCVRVRIAGDKAWLTVKALKSGVKALKGSLGVRLEYDYEISVEDAVDMLYKLCKGPQILKDRYTIPFGGHTWEVDLFHGDNGGLIVAEVELESEEEEVILPPWVGEEVTHDHRYLNVNLVEHPYKEW